MKTSLVYVLGVIYCLYQLPWTHAKIYERCELVNELKHVHGLSDRDAAMFACIGERQSNSDTKALGSDSEAQYHGLFQLSDAYWCSPPGKGWVCGVSCEDLRDDDITDDLRCARDHIFDEHQRISGDGFNAWPSNHFCKSNVNDFMKCLNKNYVTKKPVTTKKPQTKKPSAHQGRLKIYDACELGQELVNNHGISMEDVATWVCIAYQESRYNTSAVGHLNADGSGDHGLFQISDLYWCGLQGPGKACGIACSDLVDDDITDDVECIKRIHAEHTRLSGDGFTAWAVYPRCRGDVSSYTDGCFVAQNVINGYRPKPAVTAPPKPPSVIHKSKPNVGTGKKYSNCELAKELHNKHNVPYYQLATWVCIAKHESNYDTSAVGRLNSDGSEDHGLFQISDLFWCDRDRVGKACNLACADLRDNDIADDVNCIKKIFEEHTRISGDGFNAWTVYPRNCKGDVSHYINGCFKDNEINEVSPTKQSWQKPAIVAPTKPTTYKAKPNVATGKKYTNCELAQELFNKHKMPADQIATWVCIAKHESSYDTSAVGRLNWDGSEDHGLFQISDIYWCTHGTPGKACNIACEDLRDNDISDDIKCIKQIHEEHTRLSGDGFNAWTVYPRCKGDVSQYVNGCFKNNELNAVAPAKKPVPGVTAPTKSSYKAKPNVGTGKKYESCELAKELHHKHNFPFEQIATWVCIVKHESSFDTSAVGKLNWDGSEDHGLFQISDIYWCTHGSPGKACGVSCEALRDNDISDDVKCVKQIHAEHARLSGDGFNAWTVYSRNCKGDVSHYINGCFKDTETNKIDYKPKPGITAPTKSSAVYKPKVGSGKKYDKCELAQELYHQHNLPFHQIATWVCIAKHESSFDTSAVGRLNADGSEDHGLFQISDIYWCTHGSPGKACNIACESLRNNDLSDDIRCIKQIHEEHTRISGDGFNAWTVYPGNCKNNVNRYIDGCFTQDEINGIVPPKKPDYKPKPTKPYRPKNNKKGKIYTKCELAKELRDKHKLPMDQIATWVCIAKHESSFNTSAIGRLNWDGSEDHGLFQISDIYWCSIGEPGKACNLPCGDLEDNDITDDVECIKQIHEEHTLLSGDGFNAWTVYPRNCKGKSSNYVDECFKEVVTKKTTVSTKKPSTSWYTTTKKVTTSPLRAVSTKTSTRKPTNTTNKTTVTTQKPVTTKTTRKLTSATPTRKLTSATTTRKLTSALTTRKLTSATITRKLTSATTPRLTTSTTRKPTTAITKLTTTPRTPTSTISRFTTTRRTTTRTRNFQGPQKLINISLQSIKDSKNDISRLSRVLRSSVGPNAYGPTTPRPTFTSVLSSTTQKPSTTYKNTQKTSTTARPLVTTTRSTQKPPTTIYSTKTTRKQTTITRKLTTTTRKQTTTISRLPTTTKKPLTTARSPTTSKSSFLNFSTTKKPFNSNLTTKTTQKSFTQNKQLNNKEPPKNGLEYWVNYVLGGKPLRVADYSFEYIRNLGKSSTKSPSG